MTKDSEYYALIQLAISGKIEFSMLRLFLIENLRIEFKIIENCEEFIVRV
jgi:hypothetical protein